MSGAAFDVRYRTGWSMEEKIDGHRCTVVVQRGRVRATSRPRAGSTRGNVRELPEAILVQLRGLPSGVYDGELVAPSGKSWNVTEVGARLVFVVFDVLALPTGPILDWTYTQRRAALLDILRGLPPGQTAITTVESVQPSWAGVKAIWKRGGEGAILKRDDSAYRPGGRGPEWVKVKQSHAATLMITGFKAGKSGPFSVIELVDATGTTTTVKTLDNALLRAIAAAPDSFIGRRVVISYQEKTPAGSYRHGMFDHFAGKGE